MRDMKPEHFYTGEATQCLWSLQEASTDIEGLLLTHTDGLTWTATLQGDDRTQRLAAVSTAMFLLGEEASDAWGHGETLEVFIKLAPKDDNSPAHQVLMRPVTDESILLMICKSDTVTVKLHDLMEKAVFYLQDLLDGFDPVLPRWLED
ncbi:MAG: hypothetical protein AAFV98_00060 [Chloroflexota bacterium]